MKNNILLIGIFAVGSLFLNGCNQDNDDDDDDNPQENGFTYQGTFYAAETLGAFVFTPSNDYDIRVLISTGTWNESTDQLEGNLFTTISLRTVSYVDGNLLGVGDYFHSATALTPGTIYGGYESFCFRQTGFSCEDDPNVVGGSLIVNKSGNEYTLTYNLTMSNGETIEGYYKGEMDFVTQD
ncbi:MAG: hypothetical protein K9G46_15520 [Flavobacteriales bacterium]|nr:hypothetical protein [Flavobacteriales bacterium]